MHLINTQDPFSVFHKPLSKLSGSHVTIQCQLYFAPNIVFYSRRNRNKLEKQVFQPCGTHKELRPSNTAPFCFALPLWKPSFSKMTNLAGNSDENAALEALSEASKQPLELDVEGKHFGQVLLADQNFI